MHGVVAGSRFTSLILLAGLTAIGCDSKSSLSPALDAPVAMADGAAGAAGTGGVGGSGGTGGSPLGGTGGGSVPDGSVGDVPASEPDAPSFEVGGDLFGPAPDLAPDRFQFVLPDVGPKLDVSPRVDLARFEALPPQPDAPPPNTETKLLVAGRARLVGTHFSACTNAKPASGNGDRWCAFSMPNRELGKTDLWVINVTKSMAGTAITCDGTDVNCLLLVPQGAPVSGGTNLWTGAPMAGPIHPTTHRFDGDTLFFHAQADANVDQYVGPIFAWRPGWTQPRQVSLGKTAYSCSGHFTAESFVCIENLSAEEPLTFDLTGGRLATGPRFIKKIVPFRAGTQTSQWRASLSRDGASLLFSTGGLTLAERETLYVSRFDAPELPTVLRVGASRWSLSADNTKVYFLANYNYDTMGAPAGVMTMADFPTGANEKTLAPGVSAIQVLAEGEVDKGIGFFDGTVGGKANYKVIKDRNTPAAVITAMTNIGGVLAVSRDLRFLYFYKDFNMDNGSTTDGYIAKMDGSMTTCPLTTSLDSDQFGGPFTQNGSMVFWVDHVDQVDGVGEGWTANPDGCTGRRKWADRVDFWFLHEANGMVYSDEGKLDFSTLKYATFPGGNTLGASTPVQGQVARIYGILTDYKALIYNIVGAPVASDGLYLFTKLPWN